MPRKYRAAGGCDSEPADTIVRCLMVCFVHPRSEIHGTVVLALDHPADDARDVAGVIGASLSSALCIRESVSLQVLNNGNLEQVGVLPTRRS
jgi:hypothetical protein